MGLFKSSNKEKAVQCDIDAVSANRARVAARLGECEQAIDRHAAAAKNCALIGDDAGLDAAEASLRSAQARAVTLRSALSEIDRQLVDLERTKAEMADRKVRAETAAEIELMVRDFTDVCAEFNRTTERLSVLTQKSVPVVYEAAGLDAFVKTCLVEVPEAVRLVSTVLRARADAVIAGTAPATLPRLHEETTQVPVHAEEVIA